VRLEGEWDVGGGDGAMNPLIGHELVIIGDEDIDDEEDTGSDCEESAIDLRFVWFVD
jgi:hypothetical protein